MAQGNDEGLVGKRSHRSVTLVVKFERPHWCTVVHVLSVIIQHCTKCEWYGFCDVCGI